MEESKTYDPVKFKPNQSYNVYVMSTGAIKKFKCTNILKSRTTQKRVYVEGSFVGKAVKRYVIRISNEYNSGACETIIVDDRYAYVCTAKDIIGEVVGND